MGFGIGVSGGASVRSRLFRRAVFDREMVWADTRGRMSTLSLSSIRRVFLLAIAGLPGVAGCESPLQRERTVSLKESVIESARRELRDAERIPEEREVPRLPQGLTFPPERLGELEAMAEPQP